MKRLIVEELLSKPYTFEFAQAMRLLNIFKKDAVPLGTGTDPLKEVATLKARIFLAAPPSDLYRIKKPKNSSAGHSWSSPLPRQKNLWVIPPPSLKLLTYSGPIQPVETPQTIRTLFDNGPLEVSVNFFGLAGAQGPLPIAYTELLLQKLRQKDPVMRDFFDLFNHRYLSLFYRIAEKLNPTLQNKSPDETPVGKILTRLTGVGTDKDMAFPPRAILMYTRFFWKKPHTPTILRKMLKDFFGHPTEILAFQGRWMPLDLYKQTRIGNQNYQNNILGQTTAVGSRVWCQDQEFAVCLTIQTPKDFLNFLPTGEAYAVLKQLVTCYAGPRFSIRIGLKLILKPPSRLSRKQPFPFILGWTSWLQGNTSFANTPWVMVA